MPFWPITAGRFGGLRPNRRRILSTAADDAISSGNHELRPQEHQSRAVCRVFPPEQPAMNIEACLSGDKRAWDEFVDQTYGVAFSAVRRTLASHVGEGGQAEIEDIVQDVYIRLIRHDYRLLRKYDPNRGAMTTWLTWLCRSATIDHLRRRRGRHVSLEWAENVQASEPERENAELPLHLLTGRQRLTLRLLLDEEKSVEETAEILGISPQTVYSTKNKAINRLRELMTPEER